MNFAYQGRYPPEKLATMAASSNMDDTIWYTDSGATHRITSDLGNLSISTKYNGSDSVCIGNGQDLSISNTGTGLLFTLSHCFKLTNTIYCPHAASNFFSISHFTKDNNCRTKPTSTDKKHRQKVIVLLNANLKRLRLL